MRIRTLKPEFWAHPIMGRLDDSTRLLAIGLLNMSDDEGYFLADPAMIRSLIWPFDECSSRARRTLAQLAEEGFVEVREHHTHGQIGMVVNFRKHQRVDRPSPSKIREYFDSTNVRRTLDERSCPEQGTGNREQGTGNRENTARERAGLREPTSSGTSTPPTALNSPEPEPAAPPAPPTPAPKSRRAKLTPPAELALEPTTSAAPLPFLSPEFAAAWADWLRHRTENRRTLRATASRAQLDQLATLGEARALAAIRHSLAAGYMGIFEPKTTNGNASRSIDTRRHFSGRNNYTGVDL